MQHRTCTCHEHINTGTHIQIHVKHAGKHFHSESPHGVRRRGSTAGNVEVIVVSGFATLPCHDGSLYRAKGEEVITLKG